MNNQNTLEVLKNLVEGLDDTHWTSWQSTANFQDQLDKARQYLNVYHEEYINEYD